MAVCKWYLLNIRCFLSCVQIFEHFLNTLRPHFCVALCHLAVGAKIALKRGKKNCKPLFRDLHFLCELFRSRIIKFYVIWLKNVVFRLFAHSFRPRPPFNPIFSFSLKTHTHRCGYFICRFVWFICRDDGPYLIFRHPAIRQTSAGAQCAPLWVRYAFIARCAQ